MLIVEKAAEAFDGVVVHGINNYFQIGISTRHGLIVFAPNGHVVFNPKGERQPLSIGTINDDIEELVKVYRRELKEMMWDAVENRQGRGKQAFGRR